MHMHCLLISSHGVRTGAGVTPDAHRITTIASPPVVTITAEAASSSVVMKVLQTAHLEGGVNGGLGVSL